MNPMNIFASLLLVTVLVTGEDIQVINRCGFRIFVKNEGGDTGSFNLESGGSRTFHVRVGDSRPRVWAHKGCDQNGNGCETTEGYVSLAEMHWDNSRKTWYDISQVDGFNLPITMQPYNPNAGGRCETVGCNYNLGNCPQESRVMKQGRVVACKNINRDAITNYSRSMKQACPNAYSWSKDDRAGMRDCINGNGGLKVIFC